ncbi:hypothetical protein [Psychromonas sp. SP041]|uniref:hypothetical protein n=1 Tax=Psychromonas sp. SP041 TaxID=1365007 RepID=UPI0010C79A2F|nr:hypothetical protein [Psychromonas sp. SP041]
MPSLNFPIKITGISDLKKYLKQEGLTASTVNSNVTLNHDKLGHLDEDIVTTSLPIESTMLTNAEGEKAALFTYLGDQTLRSFVIPSNNLDSVTALDRSVSSNEFSAISLSPSYDRGVEHSQVKEMLKKEEQIRGSVDVFHVKVSPEHKFGGVTEVNTLPTRAKRVIHDQKVMYLISNDFDNYARPDLVSENYLSSEPVLLESTTPVADAAARQAENNAREKALQENRQAKLSEQFARMSLKKVQKGNEVRQKINELFHSKLVTEAGMKLPVDRLISLNMLVDRITEMTGQAPLLSVNPQDEPIDMLNSLHEQAKLEMFKELNGFYVKADFNEPTNKYVASLFDKDDALLSTISVDGDSFEVEDVIFSNAFEDVITEKVEVMRINEVEEGLSVIELGKENTDQLKFEAFFNYMSTLSFAYEDAEHPPLSQAEQLNSLADFNGTFMMENMYKAPGVISEIKGEINEFMDSLPKYDDESHTSMAI